MIKINLLPAYVLEKHLARRAVIIVALVVVGQLAALGFAVLRVNGAMAKEKVRLAYWTEEANKVTQTDGLTKQVQASTGPYQAYVDFVNNVHLHHQKWAWLYEEIARWVDSKVVLSSLTVNGTSVQFQGATDSLDSAKNWYLNMLRCYLFSGVQLSVAVPGWRPPATASTGAFTGLTPAPLTAGIGPGPASREQVPVTLACTLKPEFVITPPAPPAGAGGVAGAVSVAAATPMAAASLGGMRFFTGSEEGTAPRGGGRAGGSLTPRRERD